MISEYAGLQPCLGSIRDSNDIYRQPMSDTVDFTLLVLHRVSKLLTPNFSGLGVIFYRPPMILPVLSLGDFGRFPCEHPIQGVERIADILAGLADESSAFHDGFHLVDIESKRLTHVAQFVAPPLPSVGEQKRGWPLGARQMTALLSSRLNSVATVGLLSEQEATVFANGELICSVRMLQS